MHTITLYNTMLKLFRIIVYLLYNSFWCYDDFLFLMILMTFNDFPFLEQGFLYNLLCNNFLYFFKKKLDSVLETGNDFHCINNFITVYLKLYSAATRVSSNQKIIFHNFIYYIIHSVYHYIYLLLAIFRGNSIVLELLGWFINII